MIEALMIQDIKTQKDYYEFRRNNPEATLSSLAIKVLKLRGIEI